MPWGSEKVTRTDNPTYELSRLCSALTDAGLGCAVHHGWCLALEALPAVTKSVPALEAIHCYSGQALSVERQGQRDSRRCDRLDHRYKQVIA